MSVVEALLSRLDPKQTGRDRWRCACPVCGERNQSTLSIGIGDTGAVLLKCWKSGCGPDEIAAAVGLAIEDLFPPRESLVGSPRRTRMMSAGQALDLLSFETTMVFVAANNLAAGHALKPDDLVRLNVAAQRVGELCVEARR